MISQPSIGTKEDERFVAVGGESFDGMAMEVGRGSFCIVVFNSQQGSRFI